MSTSAKPERKVRSERSRIARPRARRSASSVDTSTVMVLGEALQLMPSKLGEKAGNGLFLMPRHKVMHGQAVTEYLGQFLTLDEHNTKTFDQGAYTITIDEKAGVVLDGLRTPDGRGPMLQEKGWPAGQWVNDPQNAKLYNVDIVCTYDLKNHRNGSAVGGRLEGALADSPIRAWLVANQDIEATTEPVEIYTTYGPSYWNNFRENTQLEPVRLDDDKHLVTTDEGCNDTPSKSHKWPYGLTYKGVESMQYYLHETLGSEQREKSSPSKKKKPNKNSDDPIAQRLERIVATLKRFGSIRQQQDEDTIPWTYRPHAVGLFDFQNLVKGFVHHRENTWQTSTMRMVAEFMLLGGRAGIWSRALNANLVRRPISLTEQHKRVLVIHDRETVPLLEPQPEFTRQEAQRIYQTSCRQQQQLCRWIGNTDINQSFEPHVVCITLRYEFQVERKQSEKNEASPTRGKKRTQKPIQEDAKEEKEIKGDVHKALALAASPEFVEDDQDTADNDTYASCWMLVVMDVTTHKAQLLAFGARHHAKKAFANAESSGTLDSDVDKFLEAKMAMITKRIKTFLSYALYNKPPDEKTVSLQVHDVKVRPGEADHCDVLLAWHLQMVLDGLPVSEDTVTQILSERSNISKWQQCMAVAVFEYIMRAAPVAVPALATAPNATTVDASNAKRSTVHRAPASYTGTPYDENDSLWITLVQLITSQSWYAPDRITFHMYRRPTHSQGDLIHIRCDSNSVDEADKQRLRQAISNYFPATGFELQLFAT